MKRFPVAAGNWKMNTTVEEAAALAKELRDRLDRLDGVEKIVCPPFVSLVPVKGIITGSSIKLGAQNMYFQEKGAFTGEVSPTMLAGLCQYVILGHSERRQYFHEEDRLVNRKLKAALKAGLAPILCVGEKLEDREGGRTEEVITRQISEGLADIPNPGDLVIAYEPIWAIGTGRAATASQANETIGLIRRVVGGQCGGAVAEGVRLLYGGSVTAANILEFVSQSEIDGSLVGGASLKAGDFTSIAEQTARAK
ncbi:MAG: Triosephosphate isomerase [Dehalococcoidia bacterium]|nr:Triosephosphate isomerase [Dehalococcoidia bacterium]